MRIMVIAVALVVGVGPWMSMTVSRAVTARETAIASYIVSARELDYCGYQGCDCVSDADCYEGLVCSQALLCVKKVQSTAAQPNSTLSDR